jgi:hypothetical protein
MKGYNGKLVELPKKAKAIVVTDLHGNLEDYIKYLSIWEKSDQYTHLIITGDFIHGCDGYVDNSLNILDSMQEHVEIHDNFHVLLGNHELSHLSGLPVYKGFEDQKLKFEEMVRLKNGNEYEIKLNKYLNFFRELPLAVKTENKVLISHAGPSMGVHNLVELVNITNAGYFGNTKLSDLVWNRPEDFTSKMLDKFLTNLGCEFSIVGHTCVDGFAVVHQRQMVVSSSYCTSKKAYVELDLEQDVKGMDDLVEMVRYLK